MTQSTLQQHQLRATQESQRYLNLQLNLYGLLPNLSSKIATNHNKLGHNGFQNNHRAHNRSPTKDHSSNVVLPKLVDEEPFFSISTRFRRTPPSSSRSVEMAPSRYRGHLRPRASSVDKLPSLGSLTGLRPSFTNSANPDDESGEQTDDDDDDDKSPIVSIDPFPNVESLLQKSTNEIMLTPRAPTPPKKKPKKKKKPVADDRKKKARRRARKRFRNSQQTAASKWRDQEVARRYPIRKQFLYSELMEEELKSYIPKRQPGGKLKPIYKRNQLGEIYVPETLEIAFEKLATGLHEKETADTINRKRKEELQALLQKRKKLLSKKKRKRVRFKLPKDHILTDSSDADESNADTDDDSMYDDDNVDSGHGTMKDSDITKMDTNEKKYLNQGSDVRSDNKINVLEEGILVGDPSDSREGEFAGQDHSITMEYDLNDNVTSEAVRIRLFKQSDSTDVKPLESSNS